ncbi:hypothetical protein [Nitratireductor sp. CH_MIT9313-5]|uniref:hypothetical protein n=1 Tax=Nitratireductor sp. CH_MIT9313-5 TaxID=3107764 RepID=UPI0030087614
MTTYKIILLTCAAGMATPAGALAAEADAVLFSLPDKSVITGSEAPVAGTGNRFTGSISLHGSGTRFEAEGYEAEATEWALRGALNADYGNGWNFQADGHYGRSDVEGFGMDELSATAHVYQRADDRYAAGAFVSGSRLGSDLFDALALWGADEFALGYLAGGEAAAFTDQMTFHGYAGFGTLDYSGFELGRLAAGLGARFYANDNLRFGLDGEYQQLSYLDLSAEMFSLSGIANYRLPEQPVTLYGGYRYSDVSLQYDDTEIASADAHSMLAGVKFNFGSASLKDEERNGAMWNKRGLSF